MDKKETKYVLRARTEPFDFVANDNGQFVFTSKFRDAISVNKKTAKEILAVNPQLKMVNLKSLPINTLLKREFE